MFCNQFQVDGEPEHIGEVRYYCFIDNDEKHAGKQPVALVSVWGEPDAAQLERSHKTSWIARYKGDASLRVINVKDIKQVVAMCPVPKTLSLARFPGSPQLLEGQEYFHAPRMGFGILQLMGHLFDDPTRAEE